MNRFVIISFLLLNSCMPSAFDDISPHRGRIPFHLLEKPPRIHEGDSAMTVVMTRNANEGPLTAKHRNSLRSGDVVAFHMSHDDAWKYLRKGLVQKLPYELFRFGHIALVVPTEDGKKLRLLQVAMNQAVNADDGLDYLDDKSWWLYRPPVGSVDQAKLMEFTRHVVTTACDRRAAYDYSGAFGLMNAPYQPVETKDIGKEYSCATLVVAGLHYAGYSLDAVHRKGILDIVTPRQVVESSGKWSAPVHHRESNRKDF